MSRRTTDYSKAASAVVQNMDSIYGSARSNSMKPGEIAMTIDDANTSRYKAYIRTAGEMGKTKIRNDSELSQYKATKKAGEEIEKIKEPARMAGKLAALGRGAVGYTAYKQGLDADKAMYDAETKRLDELEQKLVDYENRDQPKTDLYSPETKAYYEQQGITFDENGVPSLAPKPATAVAPSETGTSLETTGPTPGQATTLQPLAGKGKFSMDLSSLSSKDWEDLSYVVSGEAKRGTDDEYGVAASVLNRVRSPEYPNTVSEVMHQPKQYHAITIGNANVDAGLVSKFSSPEGMAKLQSALETLGGRTDFKGQSLLGNRVADEDPMFHSGGNYYHFNNQ